MFRTVSVLAALALLACSADGGSSGPPPPEPLALTFGDPPVTVPGRYAQGLSCGPHAENVFDVFLPDTTGDRLAPMVVYIHGGGFAAGSRSELWTGYEAELRGLLEAGIVVATIDYRLLDPNIDTEGVIKPLMDSVYCLQFLRWHAEVSFGADPERVALMGTSAGAGTASWLATHDDLAEPEAEDPVRQLSTRVSAVAIFETQATYDLKRWETDVFAPAYEVELISAAAFFGEQQRLLNFYGITEVEQLDSPAIVDYRADVDMLALMTADDAPHWIDNSFEPDAFPASLGAFFHHPNHADVLHRAALAAGVESQAEVPALSMTAEVDAVTFLVNHLQ